MQSNKVLCESWLSEDTGGKALLVPSGTAALEAAVSLCVSPGDEVILPSFAYPTCASSIIRGGGVPVFVDIEPETLCLDWDAVNEAITEKTRAVMPIWYAGVQGRVETDLKVIEDAAQCVGAFKLKGDYGAISFHHSKNVGCGEGGALIVREKDFERARTLCHCGTNRWRNGKDWTWLEVGSSYLMAEPLAKLLYPELGACYETTEKRLKVWKVYRDNIKAPHKASVPGNGHIFWFMSGKQTELLNQMPELVKHYEALHLCAPAKRGRVSGSLENSVYASKRIVRPPMTVSEDEAYRIAERINGISLGRV